MKHRPNILLITSDQHRADCFGFEARAVRTPHLDLLARQGTRFSACITPNVVCMPARASILTGLLPLTHGTHDNGIDLDESTALAGFGGALSRAGYLSAFIGKAHFSSYHTPVATGRCENLRSSHRYADDWHGPYMGFEHVELTQMGHNWWLPDPPPGGMHYERWYYGDGLGELKNTLYAQRLAPDIGAAQTHHSALPVAWHNSTWIGDRTIEFLRAHARAAAIGNARARSGGPKAAAVQRADAHASDPGRDRPFCLWTSFPDPHHPFDAPEPWSRLHAPEQIDLPRHRTLDLERRPWWHRAALQSTPVGDAEVRRVRQQYSRIETQPDERLRHLIANYYGMIALIDHNVGRILSCLDELGLADDTLVVFTSDHGEWLGDHGLMLKGPMFYEGLLRVGLLMRGPGVPSDRVIDDPVSTLDLAATFGAFAGVEVPGARHSRNLAPLLSGRERREFALTEWRLGAGRCGVALDLRGVRTRTAKLTVERGSGAGELYDLADDPHETRNRFDDPGCAGLRRMLTDMLESRPDDMLDPLPQPVGTA